RRRATFPSITRQVRSRTPPSLRQRYCVPHLHDFSMRFELSSKILRMHTHAQNPVRSDCAILGEAQLVAASLSPVCLNRTCANSDTRLTHIFHSCLLWMAT